jgi:hypothetical protein
MIFISNKKLPNRFWQLQRNLLNEIECIEAFNVKIDKTIYCGRPSILGNLFSHLNDSIAKFICEKEKVIPNYNEWLNQLNDNSQEIKLLQELKEYSRSKNLCLECWCKPKKCHMECIVEKIEKL